MYIKKLNSGEEKLEVTIAGIKLEHPLMNAAGTCKSLEEVQKLARSPTAAIMVGSITLQGREGNKGEVFWTDNVFSLNSIGLANPGVPYYNQYLPAMVNIAHRAGKPLIVNVAGFNPSEYATLTKICIEKGADLVELNLSCPNVWEKEKQERIACFDSQLVSEILGCVEEVVGIEANIAIKLSPFSDPFLLKQVAGVIEKFRAVKAVTTSNTFPNALLFDEKGKPRITPGGGLAGLGGPALKPIVLGQIKQLREVLPKNIAIIGCGGIANGKDIRDFQLAGAPVVQICTVLLQFGPEIFVKLLIEFVDTLN